MTSSATSPLRVIFIAAHPDECEMYGGGMAALYSRLGHDVKFVSLTNGDAGHHTLDREPLAARRAVEAREAAKHLGVIEYEILDTHDGELMPTLEIRQQVMEIIGRWRADVVIGLHPDGLGHPDNRAAGVATAEATAFITNRNAMRGVPPLVKSPIYLLMIDYITSRVHRHDIAVDTGLVIYEKLLSCDAHATQFFEYSPFAENFEDGIPKDWEDRREYLLKYWSDCLYAQDDMRSSLARSYGSEIAATVQFAETFQFALDSRQPEPDEFERVFPMLTTNWFD